MKYGYWTIHVTWFFEHQLTGPKAHLVMNLPRTPKDVGLIKPWLDIRVRWTLVFVRTSLFLNYKIHVIYITPPPLPPPQLFILMLDLLTLLAWFELWTLIHFFSGRTEKPLKNSTSLHPTSACDTDTAQLLISYRKKKLHARHVAHDNKGKLENIGVGQRISLKTWDAIIRHRVRSKTNFKDDLEIRFRRWCKFRWVLDVASK